MKSQDLKQFNLPDAPGVYFFKRDKIILYVGKATSLKDRVKSYFSRDILLTRGTRILKMIAEAESVEFIQTDSVLEALILEANEIKKHQPYYNAREKDDKSYNYVLVTKEEYPRIIIERGKNLSTLDVKVSKTFGPFPHAGELREALKIVRRIFPYRDVKCKMGKPCFNAQIGLCPGPCGGWITKEEYKKIIRHIVLFFEGKKERLIQSLEKEMRLLAKRENFEEAEKIKRQLFSLNHIQDIALIKRDIESHGNENAEVFRIEAYDIAHVSGTNVVGVMTVVENGELNKSQYRKFKIRADKNDDIKNLKEVITRRLGHIEWTLPNLIVVDGGVGQINAAKQILEERGFNIDVASVVKDSRHKAREVIGAKKYAEKMIREILLINSEAHRFAINYHRLLRNKGFRI